MTKKSHSEQAQKQIAANRQKAIDGAKKELRVPAKYKSREEVNQAAFRTVREATERD